MTTIALGERRGARRMYQIVACFYLVQSSAFLAPRRGPSTTRLNEYRFGDFTRGVLGKVTGDINKLTGKESYQFGDFTKWLDQQAKSRVSDFTGKSDYQFGDLSRKVLENIRNGEYSQEDLWIVVKLIGVVGAPHLVPFLPAKVLTELLEVSIAQSLGDKLTSYLLNEVDQRMKAWVTGDKDYQFGDITKKAITGDKSYKFGDLTRKAISSLAGQRETSVADDASSQKSEVDNRENPLLALDEKERRAFEEWNRNLVESYSTSTQTKDKLDLKEWDQRLIGQSQSQGQSD